MGATVSIAQAIGADDNARASADIGNTITLFMIVSVILTVLLLFFVKPVISIMSTPSEAVSGARAYLTVCFIGIPFITAYNIISSIFRGMGDSKSPMYFIAIACAANILSLIHIFRRCFRRCRCGFRRGLRRFWRCRCRIRSLYDLSRRCTVLIGMKLDLLLKHAIHINLFIGLADCRRIRG